MTDIGIYRQVAIHQSPSQWNKLSGVCYCLIIRELNDLLNLHIAAVKMENVVSSTVRWEPIPTIDLFAPSSDCGHGEVLLSFLFLLSFCHDRAVALDNHQIVAVHPNATLELRFAYLNARGRDIEHVEVQVVLLLLTNEIDLITRNFVCGQEEEGLIPKAVEVILCYRNTLKCGVRCFHLF